MRKPNVKTVLTWGPPMLGNQETIRVDQRTNRDALFTVCYGLQVKSGLTYAQAAREVGECIFHALSCDSIVDNNGK